MHWKVGFEFELLAPKGQSRLSFVQAIARKVGGRLESFFHQDAEPSKVPGQRMFFNLTPGFAVITSEGERLCHVVDDITLQTDLHRKAKPQPGWYRLVSDDIRLLRLVALHSKPTLPIERSLEAVGKMFCTTPAKGEGGMYRLADIHNSSIAMAVPLPGERERPCEIVTAPMSHAYEERLELLFTTAQELGFLIPNEGATHIHYDAEALCEPRILKNLVNLLYPYTLSLRKLVGTNSACRRLGLWSKGWMEVIQHPDFVTLSWEQACEAMILAKPMKYRDFNLRNVVKPLPQKHTFEVRTLPVSLNVKDVMCATRFFEAILERACAPGHIELRHESEVNKETLIDWLQQLPLERQDLHVWLKRASTL